MQARAGRHLPPLNIAVRLDVMVKTGYKESTSLWDSKETERATVKDDVASVAPKILLDAVSHLQFFRHVCSSGFSTLLVCLK